jgi:8-oxo-dGTP diphosphatase
VKKRPVVGVGAVVFNERNEILLIRRGKEPHYGKWMVPGGTLEWGETLEAAAAREVLEETGVAIRIDAFVEIVEALTYGDDGFHFVIVDYAATALAGSPVAASDALAAEWMSPEALEALDLAPDLVRVIERARDLTGRAS